ncbi:MAG: hypothetical protein OK438_00705 [Thaumarchaeota archaeon]|nr:hypothetical protein [Nitrososphaerota archaeon]
MKKRVFLTTLALVTLLTVVQFLVPVAVSQSAGSPSQQQWWNTQYGYRRQITIPDRTPLPLVNQTAIAHLSFASNLAEDPLTSFRLISAAGKEIPSVVVGEQYSGAFLTSAYLLFLADAPANSNSTYYLYYGSGVQAPPSYRASGQLTSLSNNLIRAQPGAQTLDASRLEIIFGNVYTETTISKVSYVNGGAMDYGPTQISANPFSSDNGWVSAGDLSSSISVAYDVLKAGTVQLTEILLVGPSSAVTVNAVANAGPTEISGVSLTSVIGLAGLSVILPSVSTYDASSGFLTSQSPGVAFGIKSLPLPVSYGLGSQKQVMSEALSNGFQSSSSQSGASAAGFVWGLGILPPAASSWVSSDWSAAASTKGLSSGSFRMPVVALGGPEEAIGVATPMARSLWNTTLTIAGVTVPATGLTVPFTLKGAALVPIMTAISGSFSYSVPPAPSVVPGAWSAASLSTGNGTAFASPSYYAFDLGANVGRLSGYVPNNSSSVTARLASKGFFAYGGPLVSLEIRYKASYSVNAGNFSQQNFYVAADLDPTLNSNFNESILVPVVGSSTTIGPFGCQLPGLRPPVVLNQRGGNNYLIGDNAWRTLTLSLPDNLPKQGFNVRIRSCVSSSPGFAGIMQLDIQSASILLRGPASSVLQASTSYASPRVVVDYLPEAAGLSSAGVVVNLTLALSLQAKSSISWADGADFTGLASAPRSFSLNRSSFLGSETLAMPHLQGVLVNSAIANRAVDSSVGGTSVQGSLALGSLFLPSPILPTPSSPVPYRIGLGSKTVRVTVLDKNGVGVPGVVVVPQLEGTIIPGTYATDTSGSAQLKLVPWTFQMNATYLGNTVASEGIMVGSQSSLSINASIFSVTAAVVDSRNHPFVGAEIRLTLGNYTISGVTDSKGFFSFHAVGNAVYNTTVSFGDQSYFSGGVGVPNSNVVVVVSTSYLPPSFQLIILALAAAVPISGIAVYFIARRLKKPR